MVVMRTKNTSRFAAGVLGFLIMFSGILHLCGCSAKSEVDCAVAFILRGSYPEKFTEIICEHLEQYAEDTNGDGEVILQYTVYAPWNPTRLMGEFGYADSMLFITDAAPLEQYSENFEGFFMPLNEDGETGLMWDTVPGLAALEWNEYPINVQGVDVETDQINEWCSGLQLFCRKMEGTKFAKDKQKTVEYQCAEALIAALLEE